MSYFILPIQALKNSPTFQEGGMCLPLDEEGFIEYDFESDVAAALAKTEMAVLDIYNFGVNPPLLGVNISVSQLNPNTNEYEALLVDNTEFNNQTCLSYNKSLQYFRYHENMVKLLINGYGGFFMVPCDPVNISIVKEYIDTFTQYSATVVENIVTIDVNNDQAILQYNDQGILIKEEIMSGGQLISTLSISTNNDPTIPFGGIFGFFLIISIIGLILIFRKKYTIK